METEESNLEFAKRHVIEGQRRIDDHIARVERLLRQGRDSLDAQTLLALFRESLSLMRDNLLHEQKEALTTSSRKIAPPRGVMSCSSNRPSIMCARVKN